MFESGEERRQTYERLTVEGTELALERDLKYLFENGQIICLKCINCLFESGEERQTRD